MNDFGSTMPEGAPGRARVDAFNRSAQGGDIEPDNMLTQGEWFEAQVDVHEKTLAGKTSEELAAIVENKTGKRGAEMMEAASRLIENKQKEIAGKVDEVKKS